MGIVASATGNYSMAIGFAPTATGQESVAIGRNTRASSRGEIALGYNNIISGGNAGSWISTDPLFQLGNGTDAVRSTAFTILKNGKVSMNGTNPAVALEVIGTDAVLLPVGSIAQRPVTPVAGHLRYNSGSSALEYYNGSWQTLNGSVSSLIVNTGTNNLFAGDLVAAVGTNNAVFGYQAGASNAATADFNVFVGTQAGQNKTDGDLNTMVGYQAGRSSTTSAGNTFIGANAGQSTTSSTNTFVGQSSGLANITGFRNTLLGNFAEVGASGLTNATAIGYKAMVGQNNSMVLGSINGVNTATANTKVGIGITTPALSLHVEGDNAGALPANTGTTAIGSIRVTTGGGEPALDFGVADDLAFGSWIQSHSKTDQSINRDLFLNPNGGRVGIGTTAPDAILSVNGAATKPGGGTWGTFSDRRVKKDVTSFTDGISLLNKINPVRFKYNGLAGYTNDGKEHVGVIAQEVNEVAPYMISTVKKKLNETDATESELMMYDGSALTYILVNAVKEQQQMIDSLQSSVAERNKKIVELEASLTKLKASSDEVENLKAEIENIKKILGVEAKAAKKD
jgi:hypothetical protein